jgi:hypothetical protein
MILSRAFNVNINPSNPTHTKIVQKEKEHLTQSVLCNLRGSFIKFYFVLHIADCTRDIPKCHRSILKQISPRSSFFLVFPKAYLSARNTFVA